MESIAKQSPTPTPENEALAAIMQLENALRELIEKTKDDKPEDRLEKFKVLYEGQINELNQMINVAQSIMARKLNTSGVPGRTGSEIISLAYDMMNFGIAVTTRQLAAMQNGLQLGEQKHVRPEKPYSPIITEL